MRSALGHFAWAVCGSIASSALPSAPGFSPTRPASRSLELRSMLTVIEENELKEMKTMVNLGCDFYMNAEM